MNSLLTDLLNKISIGIILVDQEFNVIIWNKWMVTKTKVNTQQAINQKIGELCPKFKLANYSNMISTTLTTGHGRFISGAVHGAFFKQDEGDNLNNVIRQNLQIEALTIDDVRYVLIQVHDVTNQYQKVQHMRNFIKNLETENDEIRQTEELSRHLALTDPLTGLSNRLNFMNLLGKCYDPLQKKGDLIAVVFLDLDGFKQINDRYSHAVGDLVLQETAKRLKLALRSTDVIARIGGDEFTMIIDHIHSPRDLIHIGNKIMNAFNAPYLVGENTINMCASFGMSVIPEDGTDSREILDKADLTLYRVKKSGKCGYAFYSDREHIYR